jgi:hypothetical protein
MLKRIIPLVLVAAFCLSGCYGSYSAGHALNRWNGTVSSNRIVVSAVHLGLWIIPVYPLALLGDFFVFNTVEFATGKRVFN